MVVRKVMGKGEAVRAFILANLDDHPSDIARLVADKFDVTRQAVHLHLRHLIEEGAVVATGQTRNRRYNLCPLAKWEKHYRIEAALAEDVVWRTDVEPSLGQLPGNVMRLWQHAFTEMFNNAIDHSEGTTITVQLERTANETEMMIGDDGVGIFRKIQRDMGLLDERHAILELSKGKLTTDPARHSGEGIFFTSRMMDHFQILSGGAYFSHQLKDDNDWILDTEGTQGTEGTHVWMKLNNHTARTTKSVFDKFTGEEDFGFNKTIIPVYLAQYGDDLLVSRSQARRLLARVEKFRNVVFDFKGITAIGQAFADEIFRVFVLENPQVKIMAINTAEEVGKMIRRARTNVVT